MTSVPPRRDTLYATGNLLAGRYRIEGLLGEGGFSTVFAAEDTFLGRKVAAKVLSRHAEAGQQARKRFEREAQLVSKLRSPHTVRLFDFGQTDAGDPFLVLELIDGETLEDRIARGPLRPSRVVEIVAQVLESLREAHDAGIIHRDLKPSNIMLYQEYGTTQAKVLDFGVAGLSAGALDQASALSGTLTGHGTVVGTRGYMAPEQALGQKLTAAADVFALGVVALEAMTGQNPLRQDARSPLKLHLTRERLRIPEEIDVSEPLRRVLNRMLAADVSQRFPDGGETFAALQRALSRAEPSEGEADAAAPEAARNRHTSRPGLADVDARSSRSYLPVVAGVAALLGAVGAVVFFVAWPKTATHSSASSAVDTATTAVQDIELAGVPPSAEEQAREELPDDPRTIDTDRFARRNVAIAVEVARLRAADDADSLEPKNAAKRKRTRRRAPKPAKRETTPGFDVQLVGEESK